MSSSIPRFRVYGLYDPKNDELRYIGKTKDLLSRRLYHHMLDARLHGFDEKYPRDSWIFGLLERGLKPVIRLIEFCDSQDALDMRERQIIAEQIRLGANLTNKHYNPKVYSHPSKVHLGYVSPDGEILVIENLLAFCKEHGLHQPTMVGIAHGRGLSHRGYTHINAQPKKRE